MLLIVVVRVFVSDHQISKKETKKFGPLGDITNCFIKEFPTNQPTTTLFQKYIANVCCTF